MKTVYLTNKETGELVLFYMKPDAIKAIEQLQKKGLNGAPIGYMDEIYGYEWAVMLISQEKELGEP